MKKIFSVILGIALIAISLFGCSGGKNAEPIIGEWKFVSIYNGESILTSKQLEALGYKDDAGIYFKCDKEKYDLGLTSGKVMTDEWKIEEKEAFKEAYAYSYVLDDNNEMRAAIESESDLDTLYVFIGTNMLIEFARIAD
ncbi:hypothetical protein [Hominifimenecus sp. rT4P-3]|uniref:hypothetical protein n=1 Tax=Hominifimenecus sp. rT4P-3 TaxID=3242979 RepID=UPI003DA1FB7B